MSIILETQRLCLREMLYSDFSSLCAILQDPEVMVAYEHAFDESEVRQWLTNQQRRYREDGFGLWAVLEKTSQNMIGQCGLTLQECNGTQVLEVGYLFQKVFWGRGYAIEAAKACRDYAFQTLGAHEVYSIIRDTNFSSQRVALRNGMTLRGQLTKHYYNRDMLHLIFAVQREAKNKR